MAKNLRSGTRVIRFLQISIFVIACAGGLLAAALLASPDPAAVKRFVPFILVFFILNAGLVVTVIWMMAARGIVKRVSALASGFDRGAEGDLTTRVDLQADDELGRLGTNFNLMFERLSGMVGRINTSIGELHRISAKNGEAAGKVLEAAKLQSEGVAKTSTAVVTINRSAEKVSRGVGNLADSASANAASIREMAESIEEVRNNIEMQAEAIEEVSSAITQTVTVVEEIDRNVASLMESAMTTSSSVAEMDQSIRQVEQSTLETATISENVQEEAKMGKAAVEATISGIDEIRRSSRNTFSSIRSLTDSVAEIGKILSVIDGLAEQTNLLALNSAIIAAQAGEHGRGFAIVAGEIKVLANNTKKSTMEIAELIGRVRQETEKAMKAIEITEQRVAEGEQLSHRSGDALNRIVASVQMVADQVGEIANAAVEQAGGSRSIHEAMTNVADMVARIASSCQEQAATSKTIIGAVERMKGLTTNVRSSAARQEKVGTGIAESTAQMTGMVELIREASNEQAVCCGQISESVGSVQRSADINLGSAKIVESVVESLAAQIKVLEEETSRLRVS